MDSESTSSQQSQQLIPSSKVNFKCEDGIIAFNNAIALLEHSNELYQPMLTKVEEETKIITFSLLWWDVPLSFTQKEFISAIGLPICKNPILPPPKETVRAGLVAKLYQEPEQSLIPPSGEVNANDTADKSLSKASEQPVTQPKTPTDLKKTRRKSHLLPKQMATANATKSLEASELEEEQGKQPSATETKKQLLDEVDKQNKVVQETPESPYDTEFEIKVVKSYFTSQISKLQDQIMHDSGELADYESMLEDDLRSVL
ncbi:hypothetical protein Tco_0461655 [Tanacetum coccineum]